MSIQKEIAKWRKASDGIRTDYVYEDKHASLGLAVIYREPIAFLADEPREGLTRLLPPTLTLEQAGSEIAREPGDA